MAIVLGDFVQIIDQICWQRARGPWRAEQIVKWRTFDGGKFAQNVTVVVSFDCWSAPVHVDVKDVGSDRLCDGSSAPVELLELSARSTWIDIMNNSSSANSNRTQFVQVCAQLT